MSVSDKPPPFFLPLGRVVHVGRFFLSLGLLLDGLFLVAGRSSRRDWLLCDLSCKLGLLFQALDFFLGYSSVETISVSAPDAICRQYSDRFALPALLEPSVGVVIPVDCAGGACVGGIADIARTKRLDRRRRGKIAVRCAACHINNLCPNPVELASKIRASF